MWKKVVAPTLLVSILWIAASLVTTYHMNELFQSQSRSMSENVTTIESAWAMRRDIWKMQLAFLQAEQHNTAQARAEVNQWEDAFERSLREADQTSFTPPEQVLVKSIRERFATYKQHVDKLLPEQKAMDNTAVIAPPDTETALRLASAVTEACGNLSEVNEKLIEDDARQSKRFQSIVILFRLTFLIIGPLVGLLFGVWIARRLNRSIAQIRITLEGATGNIGHELGSVAISDSDELPVLQRQVERVADRIRHVVEDLEDARKRAVQSERLAALGELAAGVAHEIRNPLTSVKLLIQTIAQRQPNLAQSARQFEVVLNEISRMEAMVQGLLDFARPPRLRVICHDLRQTIRRSLNLIHGRAEQCHVTIIEDFPEAPVLVDGDPEQLHLVFVNLAINGVEAMTGGGTLRVAIIREGTLARVMFSDTGPGIPTQLLDRVFEPFVTSKERGTGLGLAVSRRIVQEHGGSLLAANRPDGGAVLCLELVVANAASSELPGSLPNSSAIQNSASQPAISP